MRKLAVLSVLILSVALPVMAQDSGISEDMLIVAPELYDRAVTAYQAEDYEQAILDASFVILLNPTYSRAYYLRAFSYLSLEQTDSALADLAVAIEHAPDQEFEVLLHLTRASVYTEQESWDPALEDLAAAIELNPESTEAYLMRADVNVLQERYEDALADYNRVIEIAPTVYEAVVGRARVQAELGNYEEAVSDYTTLIELDPQNAQFYLARGAVYSESGSDAEAATDFLEWIRFTNTNVNEDYQLVIGQSIEVEFREGLLFFVPFQALEGQIINIEATGQPGTQVDPLIVLVQAEEGTPLAGDDDSGGDFNAAIMDYTIPADGIYAVLLIHSGGGAEGSVVLKLAEGGE